MPRSIEQLELENSKLRQQLEEEQDRHRETRTLAADDLHRVRARFVKVLNAEIPRLEELLVANQRNPPKTHIVDQYGRDVLSALIKLREHAGDKA